MSSQSLRRLAVCSVEVSSGFMVLGAFASTHHDFDEEPKWLPWLLGKPQVGSVSGKNHSSIPCFLPFMFPDSLPAS